MIGLRGRQIGIQIKRPTWIERLLLPRLSPIEGELKEFRGEVRGELKAIATRLDAVEKRLNSVETHITLV